MNQREPNHQKPETEYDINKDAAKKSHESALALLSRNDVQAYSMAIFSLFAIAFFSIFAIKPTLTSFFELQRQIADAKTLDAALTSKIRSLLRAQEEYYRVREDLVMIDQALPVEPEFSSLLQKIEQITSDEETPIEAFTTEDFSLLDDAGSETNDDAKIGHVQFTLQSLTPYANSEALIHRLINLRKMIVIDQLHFVAADRIESPDVQLEITAKSFHITNEQ